MQTRRQLHPPERYSPDSAAVWETVLVECKRDANSIPPPERYSPDSAAVWETVLVECKRDANSIPQNATHPTRQVRSCAASNV